MLCELRSLHKVTTPSWYLKMDLYEFAVVHTHTARYTNRSLFIRVTWHSRRNEMATIQRNAEEKRKKIQSFFFASQIWSIKLVSGSDSDSGCVRTVQIVYLPFDCAVWTPWLTYAYLILCVIERSQFAHSPHTCSSGSNVTGLFDIYLRLEYRTSVQRAYINTSDDQNRAHQIELWKMIEMHSLSHSRINSKQANIQTSNYVRSFIFFIWCVCACVLCSAFCVCVCLPKATSRRTIKTNSLLKRVECAVHVSNCIFSVVLLFIACSMDGSWLFPTAMGQLNTVVNLIWAMKVRRRREQKNAKR